MKRYIFFKHVPSLIFMVQRTRLLDCPSCGKQLEDTKQENITCKYCGFTFEREEVVQEDEEYIRRKMVVDLRTEMEIYKARKRYSTIFMVVSFVLAVPVLIAAPFGIVAGITFTLFLLLGFLLFFMVIFNDRRYESSRSKASDLSMRRRL
jgi:hypothetical protein